MGQYLLSTFSSEGGSQEPMTPEQMQQLMGKIMELEADMKDTGSWVFGGKLEDLDVSSVVKISDGELSMTDGPFAETKEQIAGFYIINANDMAAAQGWANRVVQCINQPIEVRPFFQMPGS